MDYNANKGCCIEIVKEADENDKRLGELKFKLPANGYVEAAKAAYRAAVSVMDSAASKGVYHKKTISRKASRLQKAINGLA